MSESGNILAMVSRLLVQAPRVTPRTLITASASVNTVIAAVRGQGAGEHGPERRRVVEHHVGDQRIGSEAGNREKPADGESGQRAERALRIDLRPAGHVVAARNLGEDEREKAHDDEGHEDDGEAVAAGIDREARRHREDAGADDGIDAERDHVESPEAAMQPRRFDRERERSSRGRRGS